ncbi:MAG: SRPBCC family protein [Actinomycetota bacterium]
MSNEVAVHIDAPPDRVWRLISDVTRMGEWSPITYRCEWLGGVSSPEVGARFKGYNRLPPAKWWTICEVTESVPGKVFAFHTRKVSAPFSIGVGEREMTRWRYTFDADGIGTNVTESYEVVFTPPILRIPEVIARRLPGGANAVEKRHRRGIDGMRTTLERLKAVAEEN